MTAGSEWCALCRKPCKVLHRGACYTCWCQQCLLSPHACLGLSALEPDTAASLEHLCGSCRVRNVEMALLSQDLADLEATDVPMPGMHQQLRSAGSSPAEGWEAPPTLVAGALVTVAGFGRQVHIMSTKTRPKKLSLLGSDGKSYNFLLKVRALKPGNFGMQSALATLSQAESFQHEAAAVAVYVPLHIPCRPGSGGPEAGPASHAAAAAEQWSAGAQKRAAHAATDCGAPGAQDGPDQLGGGHCPPVRGGEGLAEAPVAGGG